MAGAESHSSLSRTWFVNRCILVVTEILKNLHLTPLNVELGKAVVREDLQPEDGKRFKKSFRNTDSNS